MDKWLSQILAALAAVLSLAFVGYELKRNNDIAVVQSQFELIAIQTEMRDWFTDPNTMRVLMTRDYKTLSEEEQLLFLSSVTAWFDLFELVYLASERGVLTDEQYQAWTNGLCVLPDHWLEAFGTFIDQENFLAPVADGVKSCLEQMAAE